VKDQHCPRNGEKLGNLPDFKSGTGPNAGIACVLFRTVDGAEGYHPRVSLEINSIAAQHFL
jgi:hypothetical protein